MTERRWHRLYHIFPTFIFVDSQRADLDMFIGLLHRKAEERSTLNLMNMRKALRFEDIYTHSCLIHVCLI